MKKNKLKECNICKNLPKKRKNDKNKVKNRIKIAIHPLTIVFALISYALGMFGLFFVYFISIILHEFCHYYVAKKLGYFCNRIVIYPSGALLCGDTDEFAFKDEIIISLAGPLCNIILSILCVFIWWIFPETYNYTADFLVANICIAFFNLLPIFPLDGGRVVLALLSCNASRKFACKIAKNITLIFAVLLFCIFIVSLFIAPNFQIGISAIVIFISVLGEDNQAVYKRLVKTEIKRRKLTHGIKVTTLMFEKSVTLARVLSKLDNFAFYTVLVVDDNFNVCASISETQIYSYAQQFNLSATLGEIIC